VLFGSVSQIFAQDENPPGIGQEPRVVGAALGTMCFVLFIVALIFMLVFIEKKPNIPDFNVKK
jgi:hypothetical protein